MTRTDTIETDGTRLASQRAKLPGQDTAGVSTAEAFLREVASNPNTRLKGDTLVVGGSDAAMAAARAALACGSDRVVVVCPERKGQWRAAADDVARTREAGVRIIHGWGPTRVESYRDGRVSGVYFRHCERAFDDAGAFAPVFDDANVMAQYCDNLILAE